MKLFIGALALLLFVNCSDGKEKPIKPISVSNIVDSIYVSKHKGIMQLYQNKKLFKQYNISIGMNPMGHKQQKGDNRTPEGLYAITDKNPGSKYYKNIGISYPNASDKKLARQKKVDPGGSIKIHGYSDENGQTNNMNTKYAYTWGCIAVCNQHMKEIYDLVKVGAQIFIEP